MLDGYAMMPRQRIIMADNHMLLETNEPRFIVIEGPIGVGKTSLATRLAHTFDSDLILEKAEDNPFLERFYRDPRHAALPTQLFFLFHLMIINKAQL